MARRTTGDEARITTRGMRMARGDENGKGSGEGRGTARTERGAQAQWIGQGAQ